jgi:hypothetical protein
MNRAPVNSRALHGHNRAFVLQQSLPKLPQIVREYTKYLDLLLLVPVAVGDNNAGRNALFMNIQSAKNGMHNPDNSAIISSSHGLPPD